MTRVVGVQVYLVLYTHIPLGYAICVELVDVIYTSKKHAWLR